MPRVRSSRAVLIVAAATALLLLAPHFDFVPMWDGWVYAECAMDVAANHFALAFFRCGGHPAYVYSGILGALQLLDLGNQFLLVLVNGTVLAVATIGFHRLMGRAFPDGRHDTDIALLTAAFLLQPAFLASVIQPSLDLPVLAGTIWCTVLLIERRWIWCAAAGTAMAFSKETGVLLFGVLLGCCLLWVLAVTPGTLTARLRALIPLAPTVAPLVAYAAYVLAFHVFRPGENALWQTGGPSLVERLLVPRMNHAFVSFVAMLFVLNFAWLLTASIAVDAATGFVRIALRRSARVVAGADRAVIAFLTLTAVATLIALTRYTTFSNVRYLMAGTGLLLAVAYVALVRLGVGPSGRRAALGTYTALLVVSALRTVDPVSRQLWGTFRFGAHPMLIMTSVTRECCGAGRDQLAYSLEFTRLHDLTDSVVATLVRDTATVIAVPRYMEWYSVGRLDRSTWRRTLRRTGSFRPMVMDRLWLIAQARKPPRSLVYVALPNAGNSAPLEQLANRYVIGPERRFEAGGYAISAYELTLR